MEMQPSRNKPLKKCANKWQRIKNQTDRQLTRHVSLYVTAHISEYRCEHVCLGEREYTFILVLCVLLPFERDGRIQNEMLLYYFLPGTL